MWPFQSFQLLARKAEVNNKNAISLEGLPDFQRHEQWHVLRFLTGLCQLHNWDFLKSDLILDITKLAHVYNINRMVILQECLLRRRSHWVQIDFHPSKCALNCSQLESYKQKLFSCFECVTIWWIKNLEETCHISISSKNTLDFSSIGD